MSVVGTTVSTTTDSSGTFVLTAVPTGQTLTLRFEGHGIDGTLTLGGLVPGQTLTITVALSGTHVVLSGPDDEPSPSPTPPPPIGSPAPSPSPHNGNDDDNEVEFHGTVLAINPPNLTVGAELVVTDANTRFKGHGDHFGFTDIKVQDVVEVDGTRQADGSVLAKKIDDETEGSGGGGDGDGDNQGDN